MNKIKASVTSVGSVLALASASTFAALPTGVDTAFTTLEADILLVVGYATTAAIAIAVGWKVISMIKRGVGKL
jgi:hypothetical protein